MSENFKLVSYHHDARKMDLSEEPSPGNHYFTKLNHTIYVSSSYLEQLQSAGHYLTVIL